MTTPKTKIFVTLKDIYRYANKYKRLKVELNSSTKCLIALTLQEQFGIKVNTMFNTTGYGFLDAPVVNQKTREIVFKSKAFNKMHSDVNMSSNTEKTGAELCVLLRKYSGKSHEYFMA